MLDSSLLLLFTSNVPLGNNFMPSSSSIYLSNFFFLQLLCARKLDRNQGYKIKMTHSPKEGNRLVGQKAKSRDNYGLVK